MDGNSIPEWICRFSDVWERYFCPCLSINLRSSPTLTKTTHYTRRFFWNKRDMKMLTPVHILDKSGAILSSSLPGSSCEVAVNKAFCGSCGYILRVDRNGRWWSDRNGDLIPGFTQSLCIRNDTQTGRDQPNLYCSKLCSTLSEVLGIAWAAAGICPSCPIRAKQSTSQMVTEYGSWWLR